jgi:hypothetical protein
MSIIKRNPRVHSGSINFRWIIEPVSGWLHSEVFKDAGADITVGLVLRKDEESPFVAQYFSADVHLNWTGDDLTKAHAFIEDQITFYERCEIAGIST